MLNQRYAEASVEVLDILEHMNANDLARVSKKFINFLKENASKECQKGRGILTHCFS